MMKGLIKDLERSENFYQTYENCKNINYLKWSLQIASLKILKYPQVLCVHVKKRNTPQK